MRRVSLITVVVASAAVLIAISLISGYNQIDNYNGSNSGTINDIDSKYRFIPINGNASVKGYISSQLPAYLTWDELVKEHNTIIVGEVVNVRGSLVRKSEVVYEGQRIEYGIPHTFSDIKVEKVLKGTNIKEGDTIIVEQSGGMTDEENIALSDSDVILKGERYVMFLLGPDEVEWTKGLIAYGTTIHTRYFIIGDILNGLYLS